MRHLRQVTVFAVVVAATITQARAEAWRWARNLDEARHLAAETNRLVLVHFSGSNCPPCERLEQEVFSQPNFGDELAAHYVGVKINATLYPATARKFRVESWPTDVIITPDGEVVDRLISPRTMSGYSATMAQIAADYRHQSAVAASPYQRPVVNYGAVRTTAPAAPPSAQVLATNPAAPERYSAPTAPERYTTPAAPESYTANAAPPAPAAAASAATADRYADYYNRPVHEQAPPAVQPNRYGQHQPNQEPPNAYQANAFQPNITAAAPPAVDRNAGYYASQPATAAAPAAPTRYVAQPPVQTMASPAAMTAQGPVAPNSYAVGPTAPAAAQPAAPRGVITQEQLPPGAAPLALDGHCPVALVEQQRWVLGDVRYGITHEGRTYLFTSAAERDKFWQQPGRFAPVMAGNDPVLATDHGQMLAGKREHGLFVNGRIYLFVSETSLAQFERNRDRYVQSVNRTLR